MISKIKTDVMVLGGGPAGYSAAFRCADLGLKTVIVERYKTLGGVCLNVGCIPSKSLLHIAKVIEEANELSKNGVIFNKPSINIDKILSWKEEVISKLTNGLDKMAKSREVKIINGFGRFSGNQDLEVKSKGEKIALINFKYAIIATGSSAIQFPFVLRDDPRIWNSTDALKLKEIPQNLLVIGGGIIGLEMSTIYHALGSKIDIVEISGQIIPDADKDIIEIYNKCINKKFNLMLKTKITAIESKKDGIYVSMEGEKSLGIPQRYDAVLVSIGRLPNSNCIDANKAGVNINDSGFISVDKQLRTNSPNIFAIGDVIGCPMLAHKGIYEAHIAAEVIAGMERYFDPKAIPSIAYTLPEIAWVGFTEKEAIEKNINFESSTFMWSSSGRAIASNCINGMTKLIFDKKTNRIIGGAVVGTNGGELLGEIGLAIEMGCDAEDIALTVHAHPTLYESIRLTSEIFEGCVTDMLNFKIKK